MTEKDRLGWLQRLTKAAQHRDPEEVRTLIDELTQDTPAALTLRARGEAVEAFLMRDPERTLAVVDHAIELYRSQGDFEGEGACLDIRGNSLVALERPKEAVSDFERAIELLSIHGSARQLVVAMNDLGTAYIRMYETDAAVATLDRAASLADIEGDPYLLALVNLNGGAALRTAGQLPEAIERLSRGLSYAETLGILPMQASAHYMIGTAYSVASQFPMAFEHYSRTIEIFRALGDDYNAVLTQADLGRTYASLGELDRAIELYDAVLAYLAEHGTELSGAATLANKAAVLVEQEKYDEAIALFERALDIQDRFHDHGNADVVRANLIDVYMTLGELDKARSLLDEYEGLRAHPSPMALVSQLLLRGRLGMLDGDKVFAREIFEKACSLAENHGLRQDVCNAYKYLRDLAKMDMDLDAYIRFNDQYNAIMEELRGKETALNILMQEKQREMQAFEQERQRERAILHATLPDHIAERMLRGEDVSGDEHEHAAVLFADIVGFTRHSAELSASEATALLAKIYDLFDEICANNGVTKIKTIGDSYMAVAFRSEEGLNTEGLKVEYRIARVAIAMLGLEFCWPSPTADRDRVQFRIGVHSGPVTAGVIGKQRLQYDVWGDTVNTASRMESTGEPGRIQCSEAFVGSLTSYLDDASTRRPEERSDEGPVFATAERGPIEVKGKGTMITYWLAGAED